MQTKKQLFNWYISKLPNIVANTFYLEFHDSKTRNQ